HSLTMGLELPSLSTQYYDMARNLSDHVNTNWTDMTFSFPLLDGTLQTIIYDVILVIAVLGLLANFTFVFIWIRIPYMRTVTNYYLLNLCVADVLYLVVQTTMQVVMQYATITFTKNNVRVACGATIFFTVLPMYASIFTIALVSIERYIAICLPMKAKRLTRTMRTLRIIAFTWVVSATFTVPIVLVCFGENNLSIMIAASVLQTAPFFISIFTVSILYYLIIRRMYSRDEIVASHAISKNCDCKSKRDKRQVIIVLIVTALMFFSCVFPYQLKTILEVNYMLNVDLIASTGYHVLTSVSTMLLFVNSAINPVIYKIFSSKHRRAFAEAFWIKCALNHNRSKRMSQSSTATTDIHRDHLQNGLRTPDYEMKPCGFCTIGLSVTSMTISYLNSYDDAATDQMHY
ncbi:allatostatin-A receptor-like, partial [Saccoglossus kowalevskii]